MALITIDSNGQLWQITANPDGSLTTVPVASGIPSGAGGGTSLSSTETLQSVVNLCRTHVELMPIADVGGFTNEPALSLANDTLQELLSAPFNWKFNSKVSGLLVTQNYRQDHKFAGASAWTAEVGGVGIDLAVNLGVSESGNTVTVNTLQPHNFKVGQTVYMTGNTVSDYNSVFAQTQSSSGWTGGWVITAVPTSTSFQFTHASSGLIGSGASGIFDFGWCELGDAVDMTATDPLPFKWPVTAVRTLRPSHLSGRPVKVAVYNDGTGVLTVRFNHAMNSTVWGVSLNYQMKAPKKSDLTQTWAPFPDEFGFVYRQMFLARCYRFLDHKRADNEELRALAMIGKALGHDDSEDSNQYLQPETPIMQEGYGDY